jgi:hypothetical protein
MSEGGIMNDCKVEDRRLWRIRRKRRNLEKGRGRREKGREEEI